MIKVREIPLSKILKFDLRKLVENTVSILKRFNPEALRLQDHYEVLKRQEAKVQIFSDPYGKHSLISEMTELNRKRLNYASLINSRVKDHLKDDDAEMRNMAKTARRLSKEYLTYLGQKPVFLAGFQIDLFTSRFESKFYSQDREAFVGLGLLPYITKIKKVNNEYTDLSLKRDIDIKHRTPTGDPLLEKETKRILQSFYDQVNYYQVTFTDIDYDPFIMRLNVTLTENSKSIKTRMATNKRKARKKKALAE
ncbi:MAG: DUF6261 family protein, partial [Candidatus Saccharimonadaceae bacterium]